MSARYRSLVAGHEVEHDWSSMQRPIVVMSRPGTKNDPGYFTSDEARHLGQVLIAAAERTRYRSLVAGHEVEWTSMQIVMSRPGTKNDPGYFTSDEARRLGQVLIEAAEAADR
jgi:hypothetical protein